MNELQTTSHATDETGGGAVKHETSEAGVKEETKQPFKAFESEDDYNREIKSQRSKAKKEVLDELGIKSIDEAKTNLSKSATLETELNDTKSKYQALEQDYHLSKIGVKDEYKEEVITLAKAKMDDETTFDKALETVVEKMPFVTGKVFQKQVGNEQSQHEKDGDKTLIDQLSKKYPWIKG